MKPGVVQSPPRPRRPPSRSAIVDAAIATLAGNPDATTATIANAAGVSRATLHRHFPGRQALIDEISLLAIRETDAAVSAIDHTNMNSADYLLAVFEAVVPLGDRYHFLTVTAPGAAGEDVRAAYASQMRDVEEMVLWMAGDGTLAPDVPVDWAVAVIDSLIYTAWTAVRDGAVAPRQAATLACRTFLSGLSGLSAKK